MSLHDINKVQEESASLFTYLRGVLAWNILWSNAWWDDRPNTFLLDMYIIVTKRLDYEGLRHPSSKREKS